jgi:hypothetical protein
MDCVLPGITADLQLVPQIAIKSKSKERTAQSLISSALSLSVTERVPDFHAITVSWNAIEAGNPAATSTS